MKLNIVFDGPPGPLGGHFVEVKTVDGRSVNAGDWYERDDGLWELQLRSEPIIVSRGCVCPATSEQTCMNPLCPRRNFL